MLRIGRDFGERDITRGFDELAEFPICNRGAVNPEAIDRDAMDRGFFRIMSIRPHAEHAAGDENHFG